MESNSGQLVIEEINNQDNFCLICQTSIITYLCMPCRCHAYCRKCAMKIATGGKCRVCGEMFSELKKI